MKRTSLCFVLGSMMVPGIVAWWFGVYVSLTYLVIWPDWETVRGALFVPSTYIYLPL